MKDPTNSTTTRKETRSRRSWTKRENREKSLSLLLLLWAGVTKMFPSNEYCTHTLKSGGSGVSLIGVANDPNYRDENNLCLSNQFRMNMMFRADGMPPSGKKALIFSYFNTLKIYFEEVAGKYELRVWKDGEAGDGVLHKFEVIGVGRWYFVWYELSPTKSEIAMRHTYPWEQEEHRKQTKNLGANFVFESSSFNDDFYFGKSWSASEISLHGKIYNYMLVCNLLGYDKFETWRMVSLSYAPRVRSIYLTDVDEQRYTNYIHKDRQPILYRGQDETADAKDPAFVNNYIEIQSGQQLTQGMVSYKFNNHKIEIITNILKVRILSFPAAQEYGDLISFINDKLIKIQVSSSGGLRVQSSSTIYETKGITLSLNTWYWVKILVSRGIMEYSFFDCAVGIEVLGLGEEGTTYNCRDLDTVGGGNYKYISHIIGGSTTAMRFNILQLSQYKGAAEFRDTAWPKTCKNTNTATSGCKLEILYTKEEMCLECQRLTSEKWVAFGESSPRFQCTTGSTSVLARSPTSSNYPYAHTGCEAFHRQSGSSCLSCHSDCAECSGSGSNQCQTCNWNLNARKSSGSCVSCPSGSFSEFGICKSCQGSCSSSCPNRICITCSPAENLYNSVCCSKNQHSDGFSCSDCDSSCSTCFQGGANGCLSCPSGSALNKFTNHCVGDCDGLGGKFFDHQMDVCSDCSNGCKECITSTFCTVCDLGKGFKLENNQCTQFCDVSARHFVNTANNPPTCENCEANCLECSDGTTCTKCDKIAGFYLSGGNCLPCQLNTGKYISTSGDSCLGCPTGCSLCSSSSSCYSCKTSEGYVLEGSSCSFCDKTASKFINEFNSPPSCDSCGANCKECSNASSCSICNDGYIKDDSSGKCLQNPIPPTNQNNSTNSFPGLYYVQQIAATPSDSFSDFYLKVTIPEIEQHKSSIEYSIFNEPAKNPQIIFKIKSQSATNKITSYTTRKENKQLIIAGNLTNGPETNPEEFLLKIKAVQREINQNSKIVLTDAPLKAAVLIAPRIDRDGIQSAIESGQSISNITKVSSSVTQGVSASLVVLGADRSAVVIRFNQYLSFVSRLGLVNIYLGAKLEAFLKEMVITREITASSPADRNQIVNSQNGHKSKFDEYEIVISFQKTVLLSTFVYLISWGLKIISIAMLQYMGLRQRVSILMAYLISYQRKAHFLVLGLTISEVAFYSLRVVIHSKDGYYEVQPADYFLAMTSVICLVIDLYEVVFMSLMLHNQIINVKKDSVSAVAPLERREEFRRKKSLGWGPNEKRILEPPLSSQRVKMNQVGPSEKKNNEELSILRENVSIDHLETLRNLRKNNMTIIGFLSSGLNLNKQVLRLAFCVLSNFMGMLKMAFHLVCLISLVHLPLLQLSLMLTVEIADIAITLYNYLARVHLTSFVDLAAKLCSSIFTALFIVICLVVRIKQGGVSIYVEEWIQEAGILIIKLGMVVNYIFVFIQSIQIIIDFLRSCQKQKNDQKGKKENKKQLQAQRFNFVGRNIYGEKLIKKGPIFYKLAKKESSSQKPIGEQKQRKERKKFSSLRKAMSGLSFVDPSLENNQKEKQKNSGNKTGRRASKKVSFLNWMSRSRSRIARRPKLKITKNNSPPPSSQRKLSLFNGLPQQFTPKNTEKLNLKSEGQRQEGNGEGQVGVQFLTPEKTERKNLDLPALKKSMNRSRRKSRIDFRKLRTLKAQWKSSKMVLKSGVKN